MRVASFNLESLDLEPKSGQPLAVRKSMLLPELERANADILCLQEINGQHLEGRSDRALLALDALLEGTVYSGYDRAVSSVRGRAGIADVHNLVTLSRYRIRSHRSIYHVLVPPLTYSAVTAAPPASQPASVVFDRPVLACEIEPSDGRVLHVYNCHLRAPLASQIYGQKIAPFVWKSVAGWAEGYCLSSIKRNVQALEVRLSVDDIFDDDPNAEIILCGDFNSDDGESPIRIIMGAEQDTGNGALGSRSLIILDRNVPMDRRFSVVHQGRPQMLDHILSSRKLYGRFRSLHVFNEALGDEAIGFARIDRPAGSFHACIVAEFAD